jgi:hypothetical protein
MVEIELANIDSIVNNDTSLKKLVNRFIGNESGNFLFILPEGTSEVTKNEFNNFINKMNWEFNRVSRDVKILPPQIKIPEPVVPEPIIEPEIVEPVVVPESETVTPKRKR